MFFGYFTKKEWAYVILCTACIVFQVYLDLRIPEYMNDITYAIQTGSGQELVEKDGYGMLLCALLSLISSVGAGFFAARFSASFTRNLRLRMFARVQDLSSQDISEISAASLITRSTNDPYQLQNFLGRSLQVIVKSPILATWAILKISSSNWEWTLITIVGVLIIIATIAIVMWSVMKFFKRIQWLKDDVNREVRENLTGSKVIRAYNAEEYRTSKIYDASEALLDNNVRIFTQMAPMGSISNTVINVMTIAIYWTGAFLISDVSDQEGKFQLFSDMIVFSSYALQVMTAFMMFTGIIRGFPSAKVAYGRMTEIIERKRSVPEGDFDGETPAVGEIEFRNVGFSYPDTKDYVFSGIDLKVSKGETVAFIGATGSGKSTLINLIPRFYDATEGQVLVDGVDVREYDLDALRRKIGYVPQKAVLMSGTVESNVNYGNTSDERNMDDVKHAVRIAQGTDFIEKMENGYEGRVAENGSNFSGGQKQRLSIARAVCRKPEIYVFDDSFSALDYRTDLKLRTALRKEISDATLIIVAQRIGTIRDADKIVVLDSGKAVGIGTHEELMKTCEVYREIASSQLTAEEAAL